MVSKTSCNISKLSQVFHCRQIQGSYLPLFQQQNKAVPHVATATVISTCRVFQFGGNTDFRNFSAVSINLVITLRNHTFHSQGSYVMVQSILILIFQALKALKITGLTRKSKKYKMKRSLPKVKLN